MDVEHKAASAVEGKLAELPGVKSDIRKNDSIPSWDGTIYLHPNDAFSKENIRTIPVQVKGHKEDAAGRDSITFSVQIADLENYYNKGGTLFFVVYITPERPHSETIFYNSLLPYDIRTLLENKKAQKTVLINLKRFPDDEVAALNVLSLFVQDSPLQYTLLQVSDEEFKKIRDLNVDSTKISSKYTLFCGKTDPLSDFSGYLYREINSGIKVPIAKMGPIQYSERVIERPVSCAGKTFFESFRVREKKNYICVFITYLIIL